MRRRAIAAMALAAGPAAHAARPMITDDARNVDAKACQLESWMRHEQDSTQLWALPACNPAGDLELTFGGGRTRADGQGRFTDNVLQAKTVVRPLAGSAWGLALTVGATRHPARESASTWPGDPYLNVPLSLVVLDADRWVAHLNAGAVHQRDSGRTLGTWGFGNEVRLGADLFLIPEIFRSDFGRPFYQAGLRYWIVKDRVQVDATTGNRVDGGSGTRWVSVGLRLLTPAFLP
jgi:hypothetical protein